MADEESEVREINLLYVTTAFAVIAVLLIIFLVTQSLTAGGIFHFNFSTEINGSALYLHHTGGDPLNKGELRFRVNGEDIPANNVSFLEGESWPWITGKTIVLKFNGIPRLLEILSGDESAVISSTLIQEPLSMNGSSVTTASFPVELSASSLETTKSQDPTSSVPESVNNTGTFTGKPIWSTHTGDEVWDLSISRDGSTILATTSSSIYLLNGNGNILARYSGNSGALSGDGSLFAVATARDIQLRSRDRVLLWAREVPNISASVLSADGSKIAVSTRAGELQIFSRDGGISGSNRTFDWARRIIPFSGVSISDDGRSIFTICPGGIIAYDDQGSGIWKVSADPRGFSISRSGSVIAYGSGMPLICLDPWGNISWTHKMDYDVSGVSITPDGKYVGASSEDQHVHLFGDKGNLIFDYLSPESVKCVAITSDGKKIVAGLMNRSMIILDEKGNVIGQYNTDGIVNTMRIPDDGSRLVTGTNFGDVVCFQIPVR